MSKSTTRHVPLADHQRNGWIVSDERAAEAMSAHARFAAKKAKLRVLETLRAAILRADLTTREWEELTGLGKTAMAPILSGQSFGGMSLENMERVLGLLVDRPPRRFEGPALVLKQAVVKSRQKARARSEKP